MVLGSGDPLLGIACLVSSGRVVFDCDVLSLCSLAASDGAASVLLAVRGSPCHQGNSLSLRRRPADRCRFAVLVPEDWEWVVTLLFSIVRLLSYRQLNEHNFSKTLKVCQVNRKSFFEKNFDDTIARRSKWDLWR